MNNVEKDNELITKFVFNLTTPQEDKMVLDWLDKDKSRYELLDRLLQAKDIPAKIEKSIAVSSSLTYVMDKIHNRRRYRLYINIAAVFIGLLAIGSAIIFFNTAKDVEWKTISSAKGELKNIVLADGTKILLAPASKLHYPVSFTSDKREVNLDGEAYFEVKHDNEHQFIVHTINADIEVLGTIFNVKAYSDSYSSSTVLVNGKVKLQFQDSNRERSDDCVLFPSQKVVYDRRNEKFSVHKVDLKHELAWRDRRLSFKNDIFIDVMKSLERFYNVDIIFQSNKFPAKRFTGEFKEESLNDVLEIYNEWTKFHYKIEGDNVYIKTEPM